MGNKDYGIINLGKIANTITEDNGKGFDITPYKRFIVDLVRTVNIEIATPFCVFYHNILKSTFTVNLLKPGLMCIIMCNLTFMFIIFIFK